MLAIIQKRVDSHGPSDAEALWLFVKKEWDAIPDAVVRALVDSFPRRILGKLCFCKLFQQSFLSPSSFVLSAVVMHALVGFLEKVSISAQAADACNTSLMAANDMLWESLQFLKSRFRKKT